jgi:hypothetical protein
MLVGRGNLLLWLYWAGLGLIPGRENSAFHHQNLQTHPSVQWVQGFFSGGKIAGT